MVTTNQIAEIGLLVGEPARAAMLMALMGGQALTASELARCAGVTPQTASSHLSRLTAAHLVTMRRHGRRRYHRLASDEIAAMLESIMQIASAAPAAPRTIVVGPRDAALRTARTCYDHIAGRLGVEIAVALQKKGAVEIDDQAAAITRAGMTFFEQIGVDLTSGGRRSRRPLCRPCLDWSERRPHIAGALGKAICAYFEERKLVRRIGDTRALRVTPEGREALREVFDIRDF